MQFDKHGLVVHRGAPAIGEHTDEVLREVGFEAGELERLRAAGAIA
jgi:crotonobetainyl-CoA:carnitine CoA-transferase CaiB-like acyl-CoA transferase